MQEALTALADGRLVIHPTETCYGVACDMTNPAAVARVFALKQRPLYQPISALFASVEEAKKYVEWNKKADELARDYLPGPLTLILPLRAHAPPRVFATVDENQKPKTKNQKLSLGVRISSHPTAHE